MSRLIRFIEWVIIACKKNKKVETTVFWILGVVLVFEYKMHLYGIRHWGELKNWYEGAPFIGEAIDLWNWVFHVPK